MLSGNNRNPGCNRPRKHGQGLPCATIACFPPACLSSAATLFVQTLEGVEGNERGAERTVWNKSIAKWFRTRKWGTVRDKVGRRYCERMIRTFGEDCKLFFKYILRYRRTIVSFFFFMKVGFVFEPTIRSQRCGISSLKMAISCGTKFSLLYSMCIHILLYSYVELNN